MINVAATEFNALKNIPKDAVVVEIGLSTCLKDLLSRSTGKMSVVSLMSDRGHGPEAAFTESVDTLYAHGFDIDVSKLFANKPMSVSCTAPGLGHLVTWDHARSWSTYVIPYPKVSFDLFVI